MIRHQLPRLFIILVLLSVFIFPISTQAQDPLTQTYQSDPSWLTFNYPSGWVVESDDVGAELASSQSVLDISSSDPIPSGEIYVTVLKPGYPERYLSQELSNFNLQNATPSSIIQGYLDLLTVDYEVLYRDTLLVGNRDAGRVDVRVSEFNVDFSRLIINMGREGFVEIFAVTSTGGLPQYEATILAIAESINIDFPGTPLVGHMGEVGTIAVSADGSFLVSTGRDDDTIRFWDLSVDPPMNYATWNDCCGYGLWISPDNRLLLSGGNADNEDNLVLREIETGNIIQVFDGYGYELNYDSVIGFNSNNEVIAAKIGVSPETGELSLQVFDMASGDVIFSSDTDDSASDAATFVNEAVIVDGSHDVLIELSTGDIIMSLESIEQASSYNYEISPNGRFIAYYDFDLHETHIYDAEVLSDIAIYSTISSPMAFSPTGQYLVIDSDGGFQVLNTATGEMIAYFAYRGIGNGVLFTPDETHLIARGTRLEIWDILETGVQGSADRIDNSVSNENGNPSNVSMPSEMTDVAFQLSWFHAYSWAPLYMALENNHFSDLNLNVTLVEGGLDENFAFIDPIASVVNGDAQFGTASGSAIAQARANGQPVVAVASILQRDPFTLISLADDEIYSPFDLVGKTIAVADPAAETIVRRILASQDIDPDSVTFVPRTDFQIGQLMNDEVDVLAGWIINDGVMVLEAGLEPNFILASDYGINQYSFAIFTTQDMVDNRPEVVEAVIRGLIHGLEDVVENQEVATDGVLQYGPDLERNSQLIRVRALLPLISPAGGSLGDMSPSVWNLTKDLLVEDGLLDESFDITQAYTMQFLDKIYNR